MQGSSCVLRRIAIVLTALARFGTTVPGIQPGDRTSVIAVPGHGPL